MKPEADFLERILERRRARLDEARSRTPEEELRGRGRAAGVEQQANRQPGRGGPQANVARAEERRHESLTATEQSGTLLQVRWKRPTGPGTRW